MLTVFFCIKSGDKRLSFSELNTKSPSSRVLEIYRSRVLEFDSSRII
jgi:hypothetical protein